MLHRRGSEFGRCKCVFLASTKVCKLRWRGTQIGERRPQRLLRFATGTKAMFYAFDALMGRGDD
jgi:hypothetical protein